MAVSGRTVVIASGAEYNKPDIANREAFEGAGIYYGASHLEAQRCVGDDVLIVGGGNSAGQAAVFLARTASRVTVMVRGAGLAESMSRYLVRRIEETANIRPAGPQPDPIARGGRSPDAGDLVGLGHRRARDPRHPASVPDDRGQTQHRMAAGAA